MQELVQPTEQTSPLNNESENTPKNSASPATPAEKRERRGAAYDPIRRKHARDYTWLVIFGVAFFLIFCSGILVYHNVVSSRNIKTIKGQYPSRPISELVKTDLVTELEDGL